MRQPNRLVDELVRNLEEAILCGELRPGERLLATNLAAEQEVSLTTVREALLMLEQKGLVRSKPRRGTFVARISEREAFELCQTRALLESFAVALCRNGFDLEAMNEQIAAMAACSLPRDLPRLIQADLAFHRSIIERSGSSQLIEIWSSLSGRIGALILRSVEEQKLTIQSVVDLHARLVESLDSDPVDEAQRSLVRHYVRERTDAQGAGDDLVVHTLDVVVSQLVVPGERRDP